MKLAQVLTFAAGAAAVGLELAWTSAEDCSSGIVDTLYVDLSAFGNCWQYNIPSANCAYVDETWRGDGFEVDAQCKFYKDDNCQEYLGKIDWCPISQSPYQNQVYSAQSFKCWNAGTVGWCPGMK
jgi:hypothetical protein